MDNLETLFEKKQYETVLRLIGDSIQPKERYLYVACLIALGRYDEAIDDIEKHMRILVEYKPLRIMKTHLELLLNKGEFDDARYQLQRYEALPYISQEVEEFFIEFKKRIDEEEFDAKHHVNKKMSLDEILDTIEKETDSTKISSALFSLKDYNILPYVDSIKPLLINEKIHPNLRTYALILLVSNKLNENVKFLHRSGVIEVNPSKITPPYTSKQFIEVSKLIENVGEKNITVIQTAFSLLNSYIVDTYPLDKIDEKDNFVIAQAFIYLAKKYLSEDLDNYPDEVVKLATKIEEVINSTPNIVM